ncbi:MAG: DUF1080 domain-containing protein [Acidobacteriota bacterium]
MLPRRSFLLRLPALLWLKDSPGLGQNDSSWRSLFDGSGLGQWRVTEFGGEGTVTVEDGQILLDFGNDLTGISWSGDFPVLNYEVSLEAMRVAGEDFFCGLTFPVRNTFCSFIVGGWAGTVVGLSSLDGLDASENETQRIMSFRPRHWYSIRLRVTSEKIEAWIDEGKVVDLLTVDRKISIRPEVEPSRPLGIASWRTRAALRNIRMRTVQAH